MDSPEREFHHIMKLAKCQRDIVNAIWNIGSIIHFHHILFSMDLKIGSIIYFQQL